MKYIIFLPKTVQPGSVAHPSYYSMGTGIVSWDKCDNGVTLTTQFPVQPSLRMNAPPYAFFIVAFDTIL